VLSPGAAVAVDPALLELLPDAVAGAPLEPDEATAAEIAREPSIAPFVSALAIAAAFRPQRTDTVGDYVVVTVARVKPGLFGDLFYRGWRDTFDAAVCEPAGSLDTPRPRSPAGRRSSGPVPAGCTRITSTCRTRTSSSRCRPSATGGSVSAWSRV
jgi:hypothetical protein